MINTNPRRTRTQIAADRETLLRAIHAQKDWEHLSKDVSAADLKALVAEGRVIREVRTETDRGMKRQRAYYWTAAKRDAASAKKIVRVKRTRCAALPKDAESLLRLVTERAELRERQVDVRGRYLVGRQLGDARVAARRAGATDEQVAEAEARGKSLVG